MSSIRYSIRPNAISAKDQQFADHFFGGPDGLRGSAKACYKHLHPRCKDSTAATEGPALLRKPQVQAYLEQQGKKITERAEINAQWVLEQSIRLYHRCMGDEAYPVEYERTDPQTGIVTAETYATRSFNAAGARAALELIGRNTGIQAFKDNVEVSHTHYLENMLNKRAKQLESAATKRKLELME
jgi:phage terminase small subunit